MTAVAVGSPSPRLQILALLAVNHVGLALVQRSRDRWRRSQQGSALRPSQAPPHRTLGRCAAVQQAAAPLLNNSALCPIHRARRGGCHRGPPEHRRRRWRRSRRRAVSGLRSRHALAARHGAGGIFGCGGWPLAGSRLRVPQPRGAHRVSAADTRRRQSCRDSTRLQVLLPPQVRMLRRRLRAPLDPRGARRGAPRGGRRGACPALAADGSRLAPRSD